MKYCFSCLKYLLVTSVMFGLTACSDNDSNNTPSVFSVGGYVYNLEGVGLALQNNAGNNLIVNANGIFTFPTPRQTGNSYSVSVSTQPDSPSQICAVTNGNGNITDDDIIDIAISCTTNNFTIGGTVSGLSGNGLILQNNTGDDLAILSDGSFTFATPLADESNYSVSVLTQPDSLPRKTCSVTNSSNILSGENITSISINCVTNSYTVSGSTIGLLGSGLILQNNAGDDLAIYADGLFTFPATLIAGNHYNVTIKAQPGSPGQRCSITNGDGVAQIIDVTNVGIRCINTCDDNEAGIVDACGMAITTVDLHDPVTMTINGLTTNTRHTIVITDPLSAEITPDGGLIATSDSDGAINKAVIVQNMPETGEPGSYTVTIAKEADGITEQTLNYVVENRSRVQCVDSMNNPQASFLVNESVFAKIDKNDGSLANGTYDVYVISDIAKILADGKYIAGTPQSVTVSNGSGSVLLSNFRNSANDVLVDVNNNGIFNQGTDLISRHNRLLPCFVVQTGNTGAVQQIASDKNGNKREIFDPDADISAIRDIQAYRTPAERSTETQPGTVDTYLVAHQTTWLTGDTLTDVSGGAKRSPVQNDSISETPWVLAPLSVLASLGGTTCYDIVVDTNKNGTFDVGTDFVDNTDHLGNNACGLRVSTASCTNIIISHSDGDSLTDTAITLAGTITGSPTEAYVTITAGEQSNTITISLVGNNFSLDVPLFTGNNHITVSGIYADNSSCSQTITLTSLADLALFRAQLTWDGSSDMDLHVVRAISASGSGYSNGGGGTDDCNFNNCNIGLSGTGRNSISWGTGGEEDDPKLNVDCIACGNGIENIWMSQITEDGNYEIYVDAFSGSETDVTVTISILGTTVAQVNCGSMTSNTATDSCFVGTIAWSGGISGIGRFTPAGIKAADF